jgi:hypothetical protein
VLLLEGAVFIALANPDPAVGDRELTDLWQHVRHFTTLSYPIDADEVPHSKAPLHVSDVHVNTTKLVRFVERALHILHPPAVEQRELERKGRLSGSELKDEAKQKMMQKLEVTGLPKMFRGG